MTRMTGNMRRGRGMPRRARGRDSGGISGLTRGGMRGKGEFARLGRRERPVRPFPRGIDGGAWTRIGIDEICEHPFRAIGCP